MKRIKEIFKDERSFLIATALWAMMNIAYVVYILVYAFFIMKEAAQ